MKIFITGNMGYVGPLVVKRLRESYPNAEITGFDTAYFGDLLTAAAFPERCIDRQIYGDLRKINPSVLDGADVVISLAALSNDPIGKNFENQTHDINIKATQNLIELSKKCGVKNFVFASSCSVYGSAEEAPRTETSELAPLTAYAKSKVEIEKILEREASPKFTTTAMRFATACGASPRLRLDLVLNDFVASAIVSGKIEILSDGSPWRPLINVSDMARAIDWAVTRKPDIGGNSLIVNVGSNDWNFKVIELAEAVARVLGNVEIAVNKNAAPDKRSYRVDFSLFEKLAKDYMPKANLEQTIRDLADLIKEIAYVRSDFRASRFMRLKALDYHMQRKELDENLYWIS